MKQKIGRILSDFRL